MAGYANNSQNRTQSSVSDYHSRGQVTGYSVGLYGTSRMLTISTGLGLVWIPDVVQLV